MTLRSHKRNRNDQVGFTLIELLVVIIILGILSAVVVFAVRSSSDKGKAAAVATDGRTIRTAQEAYCAKAGHYASTMGQLTGEEEANDGNNYKFLSEESEYFSVVPGGPGLERGQGNCPGEPSRYRLDCKDGISVPPNCGSVDEGPTPPPQVLPVCGQPGGWCLTDPPLRSTPYQLTFEGLIQLPSGKIFAMLRAGLTAIYDPAAGTWVPGTPYPGILPDQLCCNWNTTMVLLEGTETECGTNCGKVLVHLYRDGEGQKSVNWMLYDPNGAPGGVWASTLDATYIRTFRARAAQISGTGTACFPNCGKVLVVGQREGDSVPAEPPVAELYDPKTNRFSVVEDLYAPSDTYVFEPLLAPLPDNRILLAGYIFSPDTGVFNSIAKLFDPVTATFGDAGDPALGSWPRGNNPPVLLPDGTVLVLGRIGNEGSGSIYQPVPGEQGSWTPVPTCGSVGAGCYILGSLADGTVVAHGDSDSQYKGQSQSKNVYLFDPGQHTWRRTGSFNLADSGGTGVLINPERGGCASNCGKLLVVGRDSFTHPGPSAELYTPPAPG